MSFSFFTRPLALCLSMALMSACAARQTSRTHGTAQRAVPVPDLPEQPSVAMPSVPGGPPPPVAAECAIVVDPVSGHVLYAKNADMLRPVASTQKIITALTILQNGNLEKTVTVEKSDEAVEPTRLELKPGESYTRRELLKVLMVKSANDVARALARDVGGTQEGFAAMMNHKAAELGMRNSHFCNPHGLPNDQQYSTARDMAIAAQAAYRSPLLRSFFATRAYNFRFADGHEKLIENTNKVLKRLPYCDGMKTGTTNAAGRCLVSSGQLNGRAAIVVVLHSNTPNVWSDSEKLLRWALEGVGLAKL
jgi:D-alanyl-D-alanine carboxypeptidase (penicillin-binding protein 5/6)